ncbi:hypothetical protein D3C87_1194900 [compost metagenome]
MRFNPDLLLAFEGSPELLGGLSKRLNAAAHRLAPLTVVGLSIEDQGLDGKIPPERFAKMNAHAERLILRSVRSEATEKRRVTDTLFRAGSIFFLVLYNADRKSYLIPLRRIIEMLRQEAYSVLSMTGASYHRRIVIGSATWLPKHGQISAETAIGRVLEAMTMAQILPITEEVYARLGIASSSSEEIRLHEYLWDEALFQLMPEKVKSPQAAKASRGSSAEKKPAGLKRVTPAKVPTRKAWWKFWGK